MKAPLHAKHLQVSGTCTPFLDKSKYRKSPSCTLEAKNPIFVYTQLDIVGDIPLYNPKKPLDPCLQVYLPISRYWFHLIPISNSFDACWYVSKYNVPPSCKLVLKISQYHRPQRKLGFIGTNWAIVNSGPTLYSLWYFHTAVEHDPFIVHLTYQGGELSMVMWVYQRVWYVHHQPTALKCWTNPIHHQKIAKQKITINNKLWISYECQYVHLFP